MIITLLVTLSAGCWDFIEIERRAFVLAVGVDPGTTQKLRVTVQILVPIGVSPEGAAPTKPYRVLTFEADSLGDFTNQLISSLRHIIDFGHLTYIVLQEELARPGLQEFEWFSRSLRLPGSVQFMLTRDTSEAVVSATTPIDPIPATYVSEGAKRKEKTGSAVVYTTLREAFVRAFNNPLEDAFAQGLTSQKYGINFDGLAVFSQLKLAGWLDEDETSIFKLVQHSSAVHRYITTHLDDGTRVTAESSGGRVGYGARLDEDGQPTLWVKADLEVELKEAPGRAVSTTEAQHEIESALAKEVQTKITDVIRKLQGINSDPLGFGERLRRRAPTYPDLGAWHDGVYQSVPLEVEVKVHMATRGFRR